MRPGREEDAWLAEWDCLASLDAAAGPAGSASWEEFGADPFFRVLRVLPGPRTPQGPRPLRVGPPVRGPERRHQLWSRDGVFLAGLNDPVAARQWVERQAARVGGRVVSERHRLPDGSFGRPHFHIVIPGVDRSGHIFWGTPPDGRNGVFFDEDY